MRHLRSLKPLLIMIVFLLTLCACSTKPTVTVTRTVVLAPPKELLRVCVPERVTENTVRALAHGYVVNTYEVWKCNNRIENIQKWVDQQQEIYK